MNNDLRRWMNLILAETRISLPPTIAREETQRSILDWLGRHGIAVKENNLASPLEVFGLRHRQDITVRVRDWPEGKVDALTRYGAVRQAFADM